mmetsp:Transcript_54863/g.161315  ORF Transcript_54863/g.161315 Transcript_54863/m.161315 type:complete len:207 (-) Transcript_54863:12-632(-)
MTVSQSIQRRRARHTRTCLLQVYILYTAADKQHACVIYCNPIVRAQSAATLGSMVAQVASLVHGRAIRHVANVILVALQRRRQRGAGHVRVGADRLRVVHPIPGLVHGGAVRQVAHVVAEDRLRQVGAGHMRVRAHGLRVVHGVAGLVVRGAVREVANIVAVLELGVRQRGIIEDGRLGRSIVVAITTRNNALLLDSRRAHEGRRR